MGSLKTVALAATAALVLAIGGISSASAQRGFAGGFHGSAFHGGGFQGGGFRGGGFQGGWRGGGWHHGRGWGWAPAIGGGVALGAFATAPYWGGYYDCGQTVVGYDDFGNPIVSNTCY